MSRIILACSDARDKAIRSRGLDSAQPIGPLSTVLPLLVKLSPDLTREEKESIARLLLILYSEGKIDGMIISDTTISRPASLVSTDAKETGLSLPYLSLALFSLPLLFFLYLFALFVLDSSDDRPGGLSGAPIRDLSTRVIGEMYLLTEGKVRVDPEYMSLIEL